MDKRKKERKDKELRDVDKKSVVIAGGRERGGRRGHKWG